MIVYHNYNSSIYDASEEGLDRCVFVFLSLLNIYILLVRAFVSFPILPLVE